MAVVQRRQNNLVLGSSLSLVTSFPIFLEAIGVYKAILRNSLNCITWKELQTLNEVFGKGSKFVLTEHRARPATVAAASCNTNSTTDNTKDNAPIFSFAKVELERINVADINGYTSGLLDEKFHHNAHFSVRFVLPAGRVNMLKNELDFDARI
eukprot:GHVT01018861.1.p1 GENE.GHVT01018861.1~~GHVT01018861.1.p1  ORF type:complete len:153 (+),score=14.32 GHVT01018861.1:126-584(+)